LNTNATTNTLFKRLKALEEIFDTSCKLENILLHKLEISLETYNNGKNSL
jgi:hypothetical protein